MVQVLREQQGRPRSGAARIAGLGEDPEAVLDQLSRHRLVGTWPIAAWAPYLDDASLARLRRRRRVLARHGLGLVTATTRVSAALAEAGVAHLLLKGVCLAVQTTGDPATRGSGDVDVLVRPGDVLRAHRALLAAGARFDADITPEPGSRLFPYAARVVEESVYRLPDATVDLHWRLDPYPGTLRWSFEELWERRESVALAGAQLATLGRLDTAVLLASHGGKDGWSQLRGHVDFLRVTADLDPGTVQAHAAAAAAGPRAAFAAAVVRRLDPRWPRQALDSELLARDAWLRLAAGRVSVTGATTADLLAAVGYTLGSLREPRAVLGRARKLVWPVRPMAREAVGTRWPWLYPVASPVLQAGRWREKTRPEPEAGPG